MNDMPPGANSTPKTKHARPPKASNCHNPVCRHRSGSKNAQALNVELVDLERDGRVVLVVGGTG